MFYVTRRGPSPLPPPCITSVYYQACTSLGLNFSDSFHTFSRSYVVRPKISPQAQAQLINVVEDEGKHPSPLTSKETIKRIRNDKRSIRANKRFSDKMHALAQDRVLAESFSKHRRKVVEIFKDESNIKNLFKANTHSQPARTYADLQKRIGHEIITEDGSINHVLTYADPEMKASIMLLATSFINSILVEINLHRLFNSKELPRITQANSFLFRDLIKDIRDEDRKVEILKSLSAIYDKSAKGVPESFDQFFRNLDAESVTTLLRSLKSSDEFNSIETMRVHFQHFKSGQYLNYDHSDCSKPIQNNDFVNFLSPKIENSEYSKGFEIAFKKFDDERFTDEMAHINLSIKLVKVLMRCETFTPDNEIFQILIDEFGSRGLQNYQSLVYLTLPQFKYRSTVLAAPSGTLSASVAPKLSYHVQEAIEENPSLLKTLIAYHVHRKDVTSFKQLLSYYRLDDIIQHERVLDKSYLAPLISKSRFIRHKDRQLDLEPIIFKCQEPVLVSVETIYETINGCVELEQFQFIDLLFNKIIAHAIEDASTQTGEPKAPIKIALTLGANSSEIIKNRNSTWQLMVSQSYLLQDFASKIFTKELLKVLLRASTRSDDLGRIMWLMPHLDVYLETHMAGHLEKINANDLESSPIDPELIKEIYIALHTFGLEGKLISYNDMLNFNVVLDEE